MKQRKSQAAKHESIDAPGASVTQIEDQCGARVLTVSARRSVRRRVASMLRGHVESIDFATSAEQAIEILDSGSADMVVIERALGGEDGIDLLGEISKRHPMIVGVVLGAADCAEDAVRAMRSGACDLIPIGTTCADSTRRLVDASERARRVRQRDARVDRLKKLCNKLNDARRSVSGQVGELCADLADAYQDLSEQFGEVRLSSELETLLRQELDIESLLRTLLEFTLSKIGPVNAAIFMPMSSGDYSVGAYVNYDLSRETAEVLLDQLADRVPFEVSEDESVRVVTGPDELSCLLGPGAGWVEDATMLTVPCRDAGECLAVIAVFRDRSRPFEDDAPRILEIIGNLFGAQLARVIQTHHRHLPKDQWGLSGDWGLDEPDDPFEDGFGEGPSDPGFDGPSDDWDQGGDWYDSAA